MPQLSLDGYITRYLSEGRITEVDGSRSDDGRTPHIVVRHGPWVMIINPLSFDEHLCLDIKAFKDGQAITASVFGMTDGREWHLPETGSTSHGWASASLISVLAGEQGKTS